MVRMTTKDIRSEASKIKSGSKIDVTFRKNAGSGIAIEIMRMMNEGIIKQEMQKWAILHDVAKYGWGQHPSAKFTLTAGQRFYFSAFETILSDVLSIKVTD